MARRFPELIVHMFIHLPLFFAVLANVVFRELKTEVTKCRLSIAGKIAWEIQLLAHSTEGP